MVPGGIKTSTLALSTFEFDKYNNIDRNIGRKLLKNQSLVNNKIPVIKYISLIWIIINKYKFHKTFQWTSESNIS